jgi:hypothetical protein
MPAHIYLCMSDIYAAISKSWQGYENGDIDSYYKNASFIKTVNISA